MAKAPEKNIVIVGGGIVGVSTAYFLTRHPLYNASIHSVTLLEASSIAIGSSGKGGGFIASWATPKCLAPLSFKLHESLAREHDGAKSWGFRSVYAAEVKLRARNADQISNEKAPSSTSPQALDWLDPGTIKSYNEIGTPSDSGQVHPFLFTAALARLAQARDVKVVTGTARSINYAGSEDAVESLTYTSETGEGTLAATDIVVAAGPWTSRLLPAVKLLSPKGHSIVVRPTRGLSPYILFSEIESTSSKMFSLDIYARPGDPVHPYDTLYSSGPDAYDSPLPDLASDVIVEDSKCQDVWEAVQSVTSQDVYKGDVITKQACYKAQIRQHEEGEEVGPIVGPMEARGLWLATGLDEWGVQNGPGVGLVMSEMIMVGEATSANVESLSPKHWI
ncbi:FAD dependent oxidoreductase [Xylariaceae sp. FL1019]|nr:FAD dependent oxidoreductase [Xylariaceae sp. FL1019]